MKYLKWKSMRNQLSTLIVIIKKKNSYFNLVYLKLKILCPFFKNSIYSLCGFIQFNWRNWFFFHNNESLENPRRLNELWSNLFFTHLLKVLLILWHFAQYKSVFVHMECIVWSFKSRGRSRSETNWNGFMRWHALNSVFSRN